MGGQVISKLSTHIIINPLCPHLSGPPKISYPPYLPNDEQLWWDFYTIGFRTLENGGVGHIKTPKKKPNFGGDTLNPKPLNPKPSAQCTHQITLECSPLHLIIPSIHLDHYGVRNHVEPIIKLGKISHRHLPIRRASHNPKQRR